MDIQRGAVESARLQQKHAWEVTIVVSDFHLGAGFDPHTDARDPLELFRNDEAFARFLDFVREDCRAHRRSCRLVILGDLFDLPRIRIGWQPKSADEAIDATRIRLSRIIDGHSKFFAALGRFAAEGWPIHLVPGNHDTPVMCPDVSSWLSSKLAALTPHGNVPKLQIHPWILFEPGLFYAEHGHQYHDINSYPALLAQATPDAWLEVQTIGAALDEVAMLLADLSGGATPPSASPGALAKHILTHPRLAARTTPASARLLVLLARSLVNPSAYFGAGDREIYRTTWIRDHASHVGLDLATLVAIDDLAAESAVQLRSRIAHALTSRVTHRAGHVAGSIIPRAKAPRDSGKPSLGEEDGPASVWRQAGFPSTTERRASYLQRVARAIHDILVTSGHGVPYYIFGHTHRPQMVPLFAGEPSAWYVNSGSWLPGSTAAHRAGSPTFPFIWIERRNGSSPVAQVMCWDDEEGRPAVLSPPAGARSESGIRE